MKSPSSKDMVAPGGEKVVKLEKPKKVTYNFGEALDKAMSGHCLTSLVWDDPQTYISIINNRLHIHHSTTNTDHPLIVKVADIISTDWVIIVPKGKKEKKQDE